MAETVQQPAQPKYTRESFAQAIKTKYPAYQEMDNNELVDKILAKYPQYQSQIGDGQERNEFGRTEEEQDQFEEQQVNEFVNEHLWNQAGVPEPLHGVMSSVTGTLMGLVKGPVDFIKSAAFGLDSEVQAELEKNPKAAAELWDNYWNALDDWEQVQDIQNAGTTASKLGESSWSKLMSEGRIADGTAVLAEQTAGGAISLIPAFFGPWGAAFLGVGAAGSAFDEDIQDEAIMEEVMKDGSMSELYLGSLLKGGTEFATELVTARILGAAKKSLAGGATQAEVKEMTRGVLSSTFGAFNAEGLSEGIADTANKIVDELVYNQDHDIEEVLRGFWDNYVIGGIIGGKVAAVGNAGQRKGAENAVKQVTKSDEHIEAEKQDRQELKDLYKKREVAEKNAAQGDLVAEAEAEVLAEKEQEVVDRVIKRNKEHSDRIDDLSETELKELAKEKDKLNKLQQKKAVKNKGEDSEQKIEDDPILDEAIETQKAKVTHILETKDRVEAVQEKIDEFEAKNEEHRADLESAQQTTTAEGKPKPKTKKQKLQEKKKKEAIKENEKVIKELKKETVRPKDHVSNRVPDKKLPRKERIAGNAAIAADPNVNKVQRDKAYNALLKDTAQEQGVVASRVKSALGALGINVDPSNLQGTVRREVAKLISNHKEGGKQLHSRILDDNFYKKIKNAVMKEEREVLSTKAQGKLEEGGRAKKKAYDERQDEINQEIAELEESKRNADPFEQELIQYEIDNLKEVARGGTAAAVNQETPADQTDIFDSQEGSAVTDYTDKDQAAAQKILGETSIDELLKDIPGNKDKIYLMLPARIKESGRAFNGIFKDQNPDALVWESLFDKDDRGGRERVTKLKKALKETEAALKKGVSTDMDAGDLFDGAFDFLEGSKTSVKAFLPLLAKLKRNFPGTKIIISKKRMIEDFIEAGIDPAKADTVKGYTDGNVVVLNPEKLDAETPIHEFGHIWAQATRKERPELYQKGVELVRKSPYWIDLLAKRDDKNSVYYGYSDARLEEEAMATAIGQHGQELFEAKQDQTQWDKLRKQIWDWLSQKMGMQKIEDLTFDQFVKLAATEIVTGEKFVKPEDVVAIQNSLLKDVRDYREVPVGTTRNYSRSNPPVVEFDTHKEFKAKVTNKQMYDAVNRYHKELNQAGAWFGVTTGNYAETDAEISALGNKYNKAVNDKILGKVKGLKAVLAQEGYNMRRDPINPGYHIVSRKPNFEFSEHWKTKRAREKFIERELDALDAERAGLDPYELDRQDRGEFKDEYTEYLNTRPDINFLEDTPQGKNSNEVIRKIKGNLARGLKRQGDYKKSKVTAATRTLLENTQRSLELRGDQLSYDQLVHLNERIREVIAADYQAQRESKNATREQVNKMINQTSNIDATKKVSKEDIARANNWMNKVRRIKLSNILAPASNNDFYGLLYNFLPKNLKERTKAETFLKDQLLDPLEDANIEYLRMSRDLRDSWDANMKDNKMSPNKLARKTPISIQPGQDVINLTNDQVVKLYNYILDPDPKLQQQLRNTGVTPQDADAIVQYVESDPNLHKFAQGIPKVYEKVFNAVNSKIKEHGYPGFDANPQYTPLTVDSDAQSSINQELQEAILGGPGVDLYSVMSGRLKKRRGGGQISLTSGIAQDFHSYLQGPPRTAAFLDFSKNASEFFGAKQMKAVDAAYGQNVGDALRDSLYRIVSGRSKADNRPKNLKIMDKYITRTVGGIMFVNLRSGLLQLTSTANYMFDDPAAFFRGGIGKTSGEAARRIMASDWYKERGRGKVDVAIAELFDQNSNTGFGKIIDLAIQKGYFVTKLGDKTATLVGGAPYMAGKYKSYVAKGIDSERAWKMAERDFIRQSEEAQQSTRAERLGSQQVTSTGRLLLAFANTPMQYNRKAARALQDLRAHGLFSTRGAHEAVRITYYLGAQNLMFSMLQQASFAAIGLDSGDDEKDKKGSSQVWNSVMNTILRGMGAYGAIAAALKDALKAVLIDKRKGLGAVEQAVLSASPGISTKVRQLRTAIGDRDPKEDSVLGLSKGMYQTISALALATLPAERAFKMIEQIADLAAQDLDETEKLMRFIGWSRYNLGKELDKAEGEGIEGLIGESDQYY